MRHCARAKAALEKHGYGFEEIVVGRDASSRALEVVTGATTVPQVYIEGRRIGGGEDLARSSPRPESMLPVRVRTGGCPRCSMQQAIAAR
jgi:glutaredoxin